MNDNNSLQPNGYYKKLNKHGNSSKCNIVLTQDTFKRGRTVCKLCYNNHVLVYYNNKFCSNSSPKSDVSTQTDFSDERNSLNKQDSSNKQVRSRKHNTSRKQDSSNKQARSSKQDSSNKQDCSNKQDISINYKTDVDSDLLCDKLRETLSKSVMLESDYTMVKMILDEVLRVICIPRKQYKAMCEKIGLT